MEAEAGEQELDTRDDHRGCHLLPSHPFGVCLGATSPEAKLHEPGAGRGLSAHSRRDEFPALRGFQRLLGEIAAGPGSFEFCSSNPTGRIRFHSHRDFDGAADRVARSWRNVGHHVMEDVASGGI